MPGTLPGYLIRLSPPLPPGHLALAFSPEQAGWPLTLLKLAGSAAVIAVIEEFFFRGFFIAGSGRAPSGACRCARSTCRPSGRWPRLCAGHDRWAAGLLAGVVYGWLAVRTGDVWTAALAHGVTNLALGVYVIVSRQYGFW
jgi:CAAX prenyl protease-like protein